MRTTGRVLKGAGAALVLLALVAGVPLVLWTVAGGNPVPGNVPSLDEIRTAMSLPDYTGALLVGTLKYVAWAGWALLVWIILTETVAALTHRPAHASGVRGRPVPGLGGPQRLVATLVAAVLLGAGAQTAQAQARPPGPPIAPTTAVVLMEAPVTDPSPAVPDAPVAQPPSADAKIVVVTKGDSFWVLAERHLGDPTRWTEIYDLNQGRTMTDGHVLTEPGWIEPGWELLVPDTATTTAAEQPEIQVTTYTVQRGDTLSKIAEHQLGDPNRYVEIFDASTSTEQPGGYRLVDPNQIDVGWTLTIPRSGEAAPADTDSTLPQEPDETGPDQGDLPPAADEETENLQEGHASDDTVSAGNENAVDPAPPAEAIGDDLDGEQAVYLASGIGGLLAVGLLGLLAARRVGARRRRRAGERVAMPQPGSAESELEAQLRAVADPLGLDTVDRAMRSLGVWCRDHRRPLPDVRAARLNGAYFELYLGAPDDLPAPWTGTEDRHVWRITDQEVGAINLDGIHEVAAPYPTLVTLGHDDDHSHVMLDLEQVGVLSVQGHTEDTQATLAAMAVELATIPWADDLQVTLVQTGTPGLENVVQTSRIRCVHGLDAIMRELQGRAAATRAVLTEVGAASVSDARGRGLAPDTWTPEILLVGEHLDPAVRAALEELVRDVPRIGIAAVTSTGDPGEWSLDLGTGGPAVLRPAGIRVQPQRLDPETYRTALQLLTEQAPEPGPAWAANLVDEVPGIDECCTQAADRPAPHDDPVEPAPVVALHPPAVRVLGPVEVEVASGVQLASNHLGYATELVTFLALHPGATSHQLTTAVWPNADPTKNSPTRRSAVSRTRKWLGSDPDGRQHLPVLAGQGDGYVLRDVACDWHQFLALVGDDAAVTSTDSLKAALALVRGRPFERVSALRYRWAEADMQEMIASIVDVAHEVARRALSVGDTRAAREAAAVGRLVDPADERTWRDGIRAEFAAGRVQDMDRLVTQLQAMLSDLETDAEQETEDLLSGIADRARRRTTA